VARTSKFDFDSVHLNPGDFFHTDGDDTGTYLVAFGRHRGNKWMNWSQADMLRVLAELPVMIRTDDAALKALLDGIRAHLNPPRRWDTITALREAVEANDPDAVKAVERLTSIVLTGVPMAEAFQTVNTEFAKVPAAV
jgi:hypothetical protein